MTHRRIALLVDHIESDYQVEMISGVLRATRASNVNALIVAGGWVSATNIRNFVYDFIPGSDLTGLIVLAGSLSNHCGVLALASWLDRFGGIPIVCVGPPIAGRATLSVDNGVGMHAAVSHLIETHGCRKIGFVKGPAGSAEAAARYAAYERALSDHGLVVNPQLITSGQTLGREDGHAAVREMFDNRPVAVADVDGLAGVNDDVTLGALEALTQRGIAVPDSIALVGFDNAKNAAAANPPLTTVDQRVEEQGYAAALTLLEALDAGASPRSTELMSQPVIRSSCGCAVPYANDSRGVVASSRGNVRSLALSVMSKRDSLKAEVARAAAGRLGTQSGWEDKLLGALSDDLQGTQGSFCRGLEKMARRAIATGGTVDPVNDVLTTLRLLVLAVAGGSAEMRGGVEDMFQEARLMLTNVGLAAYRERDQAATNHMRRISKACFNAISTGDVGPLSPALTDDLPQLGVAACSVSRVTTSQHSGSELEIVARLSAEFGTSRRARLPLGSLGADQSLEHRAAVVVLPLDFGGEALGVATFAWGAHNPLVYEQLREPLGIALYASRARAAARASTGT